MESASCSPSPGRIEISFYVDTIGIGATSPGGTFMRDVEADHDDHSEYHRYTRPQRFETAMQTFHGLVLGITADSKVVDAEIKRLIEWASRHSEFADRHPFNEVIPAIQRIVADGIVDDEERADLLWLADRYSAESNFYDIVTADMQRLHGFMGGIIADGKITELELTTLSQWLDDHAHLKTCWPYDELESIIVEVMRDGIIDEHEHEALLRFFGEFDLRGARRAVGPLDREHHISGVCAMCPEITFPAHLFCFTGSSERGSRKYLAEVVEQNGGRFNPRLTGETNYLVIGGDGNPCWAYACYGRKVEDAVKRRRDGQRLLIVHEYDFWDALAETN
jgi:hypothetical protein